MNQTKNVGPPPSERWKCIEDEGLCVEHHMPAWLEPSLSLFQPCQCCIENGLWLLVECEKSFDWDGLKWSEVYSETEIWHETPRQFPMSQ